MVVQSNHFFYFLYDSRKSLSSSHPPQSPVKLHPNWHICPSISPSFSTRPRSIQRVNSCRNRYQDWSKTTPEKREQLGALWRVSCANLVCQCKCEEFHCCFTEGRWLSGGMSIEFKARREGEKDRWLGLWTQQRPPLILDWVSICFASLPKAITQLPFFHPFLWSLLLFSSLSIAPFSIREKWSLGAAPLSLLSYGDLTVLWIEYQAYACVFLGHLQLAICLILVLEAFCAWGQNSSSDPLTYSSLQPGQLYSLPGT